MTGSIHSIVTTVDFTLSVWVYVCDIAKGSFTVSESKIFLSSLSLLRILSL